MGNKYSSVTPPYKEVIDFSNLSETDMVEYRENIVKGIKSTFVEKHPEISIMHIIDQNPFSNNTRIVFSFNEMNKMCKEAIPVPFVVLYDDTDFKVILVQNYNIRSNAEI